MFVSVAGGFVFYGDSSFDRGIGTNPTAAIAVDKQALLPGQTAGFNNYISYDKGINGIIIDLSGWDRQPIPLDYRMGRSSDTSTWTPAPQPKLYEQYVGGGVNGSDRVVIRWRDNSIRDEWLQVTLGGPGSEMPTPDVFYFGDQVGSSEQSATSAAVTLADEYGARLDSHTFSHPAPITNVHDYNRDGRVDAADQLIARDNISTADNTIQLFGTSTGPDTRWDFASFLRIVQPMQHSLQGHQPMVYWSLPMPTGDYVAMQADGTLQSDVAQILARGFVPQLFISDTSDVATEVALGQTLQQAGVPVNVVFPRNDVLEATLYQNSPLWITAPDGSAAGTLRQWTALPLGNPAAGAAYVGGLLAPLKAAGVTVNQVMFDDESMPNPWNGAYEAQANPLLAPYYPPGTLSSYWQFENYVLALRTQYEQQIMVNPVHALWPNAYVGNFNEADSSAANPWYASNGTVMPARTLGPTTLSLPGAYAGSRELVLYTSTITQANADHLYLRYLLRTVTSALQNRQPFTRDIPFLSQIDNAASPLPVNEQLGMSTAQFQELLRHVWLRGADGQMIFTYTPSATVGLPQVEAARSVFDELLGYGAFLSRGTPMNLGIPDLNSFGPIWSGLKLGNQCLIRTFTDAATDGTVTINAFPGVAVTLPAPTTGATFIVNSDGTFTRVDSGAHATVGVAASSNLNASASQPAPTPRTQTSSQFWQEWETRKKVLAGKARHPASGTFSSAPIRA
jgi:hypothetical protein